MIKSWSDAAWEDFEYWTKQDKKTLRRILQLLKDIDRNGYEGIGKPERLSGDLASYWSRRIDDANIALIENVINKDKTAKIFVQVYGLEDKDKVITVDTLIIFSKLSLAEIKQIFNEPKDIFPSDIGEETDFSQPTFLIGDNGDLISITELSYEQQSVYYCWWD